MDHPDPRPARTAEDPCMAYGKNHPDPLRNIIFFITLLELRPRFGKSVHHSISLLVDMHKSN